MVFQNDILAGSSGASGTSTAVHTIDQSIRFNGVDTPQLTRTPSSGGNQDKWTFSCWVKRGKLGQSGGGGSHQILLSAGNDVNNFTFFGFRDSGSLPSGGVAESLNLFATVGGSVIFELSTTQVFRDPSAWYHIVGVYDSGNSVSSERCRVYVNGSRITEFNVETYPSQNQDSDVNESGAVQRVGALNLGGNKGHLDGYLAEIVLIDGQALDPSSFGLYNDSNIWIPKDVSGLTFGTNGFHIKGESASDLGNDSSSNNNDFTTSGLASHDQVSDSPTNNFATINSIYADNAPAGNAGTLSNGNLQYVGGGSTFSIKGFTYNLPKSGKWYFEYMIGGSLDGFGFVKQGEQGTINASNGPGQLSVAQGGGIQYTGWRNGGNNTTTFADSNTGSPFTTGFIHQVAIDVDNGKFYYGVKNTYYAADGGSDGNPSAGTNHMSTFAFSTTDVVLLAGNYSGTQYWNFGQDGTFAGQQTAQGNADANGVGNFYYAPPTGYLALCSKNVGS